MLSRRQRKCLDIALDARRRTVSQRQSPATLPRRPPTSHHPPPESLQHRFSAQPKLSFSETVISKGFHLREVQCGFSENYGNHRTVNPSPANRVTSQPLNLNEQPLGWKKVPGGPLMARRVRGRWKKSEVIVERQRLGSVGAPPKHCLASPGEGSRHDGHRHGLRRKSQSGGGGGGGALFRIGTQQRQRELWSEPTPASKSLLGQMNVKHQPPGK
ncbi:hypothetical protein HPP92_012382 [Vanilla planifolia]|uniref:Uncharacterized protein n=1 Tax=Vanilla planifolia TaxID=51239 RepID=A0A835R0A9_VANPL|nr:hypothetical protein HPP92_012741 [Vanilla planifolia]KAG0477663.1 hypothetical protein HPP92_012382 [Vanilla planifolia]